MLLLHPWAFMACDRMKLTFNFIYAFYVCMYFFIYLSMLHYCEIILHALKVLVTEHLF